MPLMITCPRCGATSHNPNDIREGYCGRCHWWTSDPVLGQSVVLEVAEQDGAIALPSPPTQHFELGARKLTKLLRKMQVATAGLPPLPIGWTWGLDSTMTHGRRYRVSMDCIPEPPPE